MNGAWEWFKENRQRFAWPVLVIGALVVGGSIFKQYPQDVTIKYRLGDSHAEVKAVTLHYHVEGEEAAGVRLEYPEGAPAIFVHEVELSPARYEVLAEIERPGHVMPIRRAMSVPSEGIVVIDLFDEALARR